MKNDSENYSRWSYRVRGILAIRTIRDSEKRVMQFVKKNKVVFIAAGLTFAYLWYRAYTRTGVASIGDITVIEYGG